MIVSIGILARNEEARIAQAIRSLSQQSVFSEYQHGNLVSQWEVAVVPNGCTDATAAVAARTLDACLATMQRMKVETKIFEIGEPGKSNAWNQYVHALSREDADTIVMIDGDIEFDHPHTIYNSLRVLIDNPECLVAVDRPQKDFARKPRRTFIEELSLQISKDTLEGPPGVAGSFYCARAGVLRNIWMPIGLPAEDGFVKSMVITDFFRSAEVPSRIVRADNASHFYEGLRDPRAVFRHEVRLVVGTALNCYLTWDFLKFATDPKGPGAGHLIRSCLENDPDWYRKLMNNAIMNRGWWVLPRGMVLRRILRLRGMPLWQKLRRLPLASLAFLFDLAVFAVANHRLKSGKAVGYW